MHKESSAGLRMKTKGIIYEMKCVEHRIDTQFLRPLTNEDATEVTNEERVTKTDCKLLDRDK